MSSSEPSSPAPDESPATPSSTENQETSPIVSDEPAVTPAATTPSEAAPAEASPVIVPAPVVDPNTPAEPTLVTETAPVIVPEAVEPVQPPPLSVAPPAPVPAGKLLKSERLPNASVGKPYNRNARDLFGENAGCIAQLSVRLPVDSGLSYNDETGEITGTPTQAGEFKVGLSFQVEPASADRPTLTQDVALTINPDPSSLWKNIPSDSAGPFAKPDTDKDHLDTPHIIALGASLRGRSHAHEGKYRDDDFSMRQVEGTSWHLFVAADGAGSAKYSRRGAQLACETAAAQLSAHLGAGNDLDDALTKLSATSSEEETLEKLRRTASNFFNRAAYEGYRSIHGQAGNVNATPRDFATTLIAVIVRRVEERWFIASFAIGDGGAGVFIGPGKLRILTQPDSGDFAGQTVFLTTGQIFQDSGALLARTQVTFCDDFRFLAVMTDGISDPIFPNDAAFASVSAWEQFESKLAGSVNLDALAAGGEEALLKWMEFPSPGNHDDRTLILAAPKRAGASV